MRKPKTVVVVLASMTAIAIVFAAATEARAQGRGGGGGGKKPVRTPLQIEFRDLGNPMDMIQSDLLGPYVDGHGLIDAAITPGGDLQVRYAGKKKDSPIRELFFYFFVPDPGTITPPFGSMVHDGDTNIVTSFAANSGDHMRTMSVGEAKVARIDFTFHDALGEKWWIRTGIDSQISDSITIMCTATDPGDPDSCGRWELVPNADATVRLSDSPTADDDYVGFFSMPFMITATVK